MTKFAAALPLLCALTLSAAPAAAQAVQRAEETLVEEVVAWINDDVVLYGDLREQEQELISQTLQESRREGVPAEELSRRVQAVKDRLLAQLIGQRLLVQEAERLYDINEVRKDVMKRFKERQKIKTDEELETQLKQWGMTRAELEDKLIQNAAPDFVVDMQVNRTLSVSEAEARAFYEQHRDRFGTPAQVTFREIVLLDTDPARRAARKADAERIATEARAPGADFAALVKTRSEAPSRALEGRIGPVQAGDLVPAIGRALLDAPPGGIVGPIESGQGWHVLRLEERQDAVTPAFEAVRTEVENGVREAKFGPALETFLGGLWRGATIEVRKAYLDRIPAEFRAQVIARD